ncbi:hypothetical protein NC651_005841 [Populus alba x Populus x berolinensis]|nr:hypothetical protein NC651_005841 [Populus alba x Populus x berolinensis]
MIDDSIGPDLSTDQWDMDLVRAWHLPTLRQTAFRFTEDVKLILVQDYNRRGLERTIYSDRSTTYQTGLEDTKRGNRFPVVISPRASQDGRMVLFLRGYNNKEFCSREERTHH